MDIRILDKILRIHKIRPTKVRRMVLEVARQQKSALSLTDFEDVLLDVDRSTLFRTLQLFERNGILHAVLDGKGIKNYALCHKCTVEVHKDIHAHLKCLKCKKIHCIELDMNCLISPSAPYRIDSLSILADGLCDVCNKVA